MPRRKRALSPGAVFSYCGIPGCNFKSHSYIGCSNHKRMCIASRAARVAARLGATGRRDLRVSRASRPSPGQAGPCAGAADGTGVPRLEDAGEDMHEETAGMAARAAGSDSPAAAASPVLDLQVGGPAPALLLPPHAPWRPSLFSGPQSGTADGPAM